MQNEIEELDNFITTNLPDFKQMVDEHEKNDKTEIVIHQDAFAADYQEDEYILLGRAVKYAGLKGITLTIFGLNRETVA